MGPAARLAQQRDLGPQSSLKKTGEYHWSKSCPPVKQCRLARQVKASARSDILREERAFGVHSTQFTFSKHG